MAMHTYNPRAWGLEAGGLLIQGDFSYLVSLRQAWDTEDIIPKYK